MSSDSSRGSPIVRGVIVAALLLAAAAAVSWVSPRYIDAEWHRRLFGVITGCVVLLYANAVPKALVPLARLRNPVIDQAMRRFAGWALVLGGVGYILAWLIAPIAAAWWVAAALLGTAVVVMIARLAWATRGRFT